MTMATRPRRDRQRDQSSELPNPRIIDNKTLIDALDGAWQIERYHTCHARHRYSSQVNV
jgi:hypothetical protein